MLFHAAQYNLGYYQVISILFFYFRFNIYFRF